MADGEYLLEVRAEEIPARMLEPAIKELGTRLFEELMALGLGPREIETLFTPRRLVLILSGLPAKEPDREEQVVGPPASVAYDDDGEPTPALTGFARRCGVEPDELEKVETDKGVYIAATQHTAGRPTAAVLAELVPQLIAGLSWAKTMVWGDGHGPWARPVHGLVSLLDGEVVPIELFGVSAGNVTVGHPILSPEPFEVGGAAGYKAALAERSIEPSAAARREALWQGMTEAAAARGGLPMADDELLAKLAAICEVPGVLEGDFDADYLDLPREVLIVALKDHQSAFTVERAEPEERDEIDIAEGAVAEEPEMIGTGELLPCFLTLMDRPDDPDGRVRRGNEWVVEARLADARFFYQEDRKRSLADRAGDLAHLTFHEELGSYADKAERLAGLAGLLCRELGLDVLAPAAEEAARLLKVDLTTEMVKELTSLQGVMGGIYAREDGQEDEVWRAIYDQYLPASTDDPIPRGTVGRITALADRIDTVVGIFGLGLVPTGSRDPFGLRRAAQGAVRIALEGELPFDLDLVAAKAARLYGDRLKKSGEEILESLRPFFNDRIRYLLGIAGYAHDEIEAALKVGANHLPDLEARVEALHKVREEKSFLSVVLSAKRIANILKDAPEHELDPGLLTEGAEKDLHTAFSELREEVEEAAAGGDYERCLRRTADLAEPLDRFFVEVLVMDENEKLRKNRIALLQAIHRVVTRTARLTEMVVDKAEHRARHGE